MFSIVYQTTTNENQFRFIGPIGNLSIHDSILYYELNSIQSIQIQLYQLTDQSINQSILYHHKTKPTSTRP